MEEELARAKEGIDQWAYYEELQAAEAAKVAPPGPPAAVMENDVDDDEEAPCITVTWGTPPDIGAAPITHYRVEITEEQYEAASERVCSNIAAATADSEDDDSDGWCSDDSDDLGAAGKRESTVRVVTRRSMSPSAGRFNVWEMEGHRARS